MLIVLKKSYLFGFASIVLVAVLAIAVFGMTEPTKSPVPVLKNAYILDAGHGGLDGGASGKSGILEKDINLKVTMYLKEILEANGNKVILTRDSDKSLHTTNSARIRSQKRSDLENRVKVMKQYPNYSFISIHMNKFEQSKYKGAQVFYANNDQSRILGEKIQQGLIDGLKDGNTRKAKIIPKEVYMFKNVPSVAVVVECGFLSNPEEEKLLSTDEYQKKLAQCIYNAIKS